MNEHDDPQYRYDHLEGDTSDARQSLLLAVLAAVEYIEALEVRVAKLEAGR